MSFNFPVQPPSATPPLDWEHVRLGRLLVSHFITPQISQRLKDSSPIIFQQHSYLTTLNYFFEKNRTSLAAIRIYHDLEEHTAITDNLSIHLNEVERLMINHINEHLRTMVQNHVVQRCGDLLLRGENPYTHIRTTSLCRNCGYVGHFPIECSFWNCLHCGEPAPQHLSTSCPAHPDRNYQQQETLEINLPSLSTFSSTLRPEQTQESSEVDGPTRITDGQTNESPSSSSPSPTLFESAVSGSDQENRNNLQPETLHRAGSHPPQRCRVTIRRVAIVAQRRSLCYRPYLLNSTDSEPQESSEEGIVPSEGDN